jgi:hypothetical protein
LVRAPLLSFACPCFFLKKKTVWGDPHSEQPFN